MSATRLSLYNDALLLCGERRLASLSEGREPRYLLDQVWDNGVIDYCLEQGLWNFAMRTVMVEYSPSVEPPFGYRRAFDKPTDYIRTAAFCSDGFFQVPLLQYVDEANFWFTNLDVIYVRYVSNDSSYGADLGKWPRTFERFVSAQMAADIVTKITQDEAKQAKVDKKCKDALLTARNVDAMNEPSARPPAGAWLSARSRGGTRSDGGNSGSLIG